MQSLQYTLQSMMPSLLGVPTANDVVTYGSYGIQNGHPDSYLCNAITGVGVDTSTLDPTSFLALVGSLQTGTNTVWAQNSFSEEELEAQTLFGMSFLPWNTAVFKRTLQSNQVIPMNPWNSHTLMENGLTIAKIAGISAGTYYGTKFAWKAYSKSS